MIITSSADKLKLKSMNYTSLNIVTGICYLFTFVLFVFLLNVYMDFEDSQGFEDSPLDLIH